MAARHQAPGPRYSFPISGYLVWPAAAADTEMKSDYISRGNLIILINTNYNHASSPVTIIPPHSTQLEHSDNVVILF